MRAWSASVPVVGDRVGDVGEAEKAEGRERARWSANVVVCIALGGGEE